MFILKYNKLLAPLGPEILRNLHPPFFLKKRQVSSEIAVTSLIMKLISDRFAVIISEFLKF